MDLAFHDRQEGKIRQYFPEKLIRKLRMITEKPITLVEAPIGFGKTSAVRHFVNSIDEKCSWINVSSGSKEIFWNDFCDIVRGVGKDVEAILRNIGYPDSDSDVVAIRNLVKKDNTPENIYLIIDNYDSFADSYFDKLILSSADVMTRKLHFIIIGRNFKTGRLYDARNSENVHYISQNDLTLEPEDIRKFFNINGINISESEALELYDFSHGWVCAVNLEMVIYSETGRFEKSSAIDELVEKAVWNKLDDKKKYYSVCLAKLGNFTLREAFMVIPEGSSEEWALETINGITFTRHDRSVKKYYISPVFSSFYNYEYDIMSEENRNRISCSVGNVLESRKEYVEAYEYYLKAGRWDLIYESKPFWTDIYPDVNNDNREFFMIIACDCPYEIKRENWYFSLIMCLVLFIYNQKGLLSENLDIIEDAISTDKETPQKKVMGYTELLYFVRGYTSLNDFRTMKFYYEKALELDDVSVKYKSVNVPFALGSPSVFYICHRDVGKAWEETELIEKMMSVYFKLTFGHGNGADALFKAELLFFQGEFEDAERLCYKTLYMADSREQAGITLGALLVLARMSIYEGNYENTMSKIADFRKKIRLDSSDEKIYSDMIDVCESSMYIILGEHEKISDWLKDYKRIESKVNLIAMNFANMIHARYLYLNGDYQQILGISGKFLEIADMFSEPMAKIFIYIAIALSELAVGERVKAARIIEDAMKLAVPDSLVIPFVESYRFMSDILVEARYPDEYAPFIKKVKKLSVKFDNGMKSIVREMRNNDNFGLTARETEVARLAAERYSNKEIAEKLFIAESTVKSNLKSVYSKLDINSRSQLPAFFGNK